MHVQVQDWFAARAGAPGLRVLEIGSLDVNGGLRGLFADATAYHGIDLVAGPGVDEVADATEWRSATRFDLVLCAEVLEHAPDWAAVVETAWTALVPRGRLLLTCATDPRPPHSAVDGLDLRSGEHYANVPGPALVRLLRDRGCEELDVEQHLDRGDLYLDATKPPRPD